jgi:hypothetical protein
MDSDLPPGIDLNADTKQTGIKPIIGSMILAATAVTFSIVSKLSVKVTPQLDDCFVYVALARIALDLNSSVDNVLFTR